jgi:hypothetical protein
MTLQFPSFSHTVFYAYLIKVNGNLVGSIQKMSIRGERGHERIGEINYNGVGEQGLQYKDILTGYEDITIDLEHIEFYTMSFMQAIANASNYTSLSTFNFAFDIEEYLYGQKGHQALPGVAAIPSPLPVVQPGTPPATSAKLLRTITYVNCVPTSYSKSIDRGTIHIAETMTVACLYAKDGLKASS